MTSLATNETVVDLFLFIFWIFLETEKRNGAPALLVQRHGDDERLFLVRRQSDSVAGLVGDAQVRRVVVVVLDAAAVLGVGQQLGVGPHRLHLAPHLGLQPLRLRAPKKKEQNTTIESIKNHHIRREKLQVSQRRQRWSLLFYYLQLLCSEM